MWKLHALKRMCKCCMKSAKKAAPWIEGRMWKSGAEKRGHCLERMLKLHSVHLQCTRLERRLECALFLRCRLTYLSPSSSPIYPPVSCPSLPLFLTHLSSSVSCLSILLFLSHLFACFLPIYSPVSHPSIPLFLTHLSFCFAPIYPPVSCPSIPWQQIHCLANT